MNKCAQKLLELTLHLFLLYICWSDRLPFTMNNVLDDHVGIGESICSYPTVTKNFVPYTKNREADVYLIMETRDFYGLGIMAKFRQLRYWSSL